MKMVKIMQIFDIKIINNSWVISGIVDDSQNILTPFIAGEIDG